MGDINLVDILIYILNFCGTLVVLYYLLYKPVSKFLSDRKDRIANSLQEAETTHQEAEAVLKDAKTELTRTIERARQLSHEAIDNAALDAEHILDNAQEKAAETILRAREQVKAERQAALEHAYTEIVSFAGGLASRILTREVTIEDNREIVDRFFSETVEQGEHGSESVILSNAENEIASETEDGTDSKTETGETVTVNEIGEAEETKS